MNVQVDFTFDRTFNQKYLAPRSTEQFEQLRAESKERILTSAFELFAEEGYHGTSVSKISRNAGISKGLLYNYFESKEELLVAIMRSLMDEIDEFFSFDRFDEVDEEVLMDWIDMSFEVVQRDIQKWRLYIALSTQPEVTPILMKTANDSVLKFMTGVHKFFESKGIDNAQEWIRHIAAIVDGVQLHITMDPENYPVDFSKNIIKTQIKALLK